MEIRTYLQIIARYWWLVLLAVIVGGAIMALLDRRAVPIYRTQTRMVVRPSSSLTDPRLTIESVATLGSRYVAGTFAQMVTTSQVRDEARTAVGLSDAAAGDYDFVAAVLPDTAVIQITATGPDPTILSTYLDATVQATVRDTADLFGVMELAPLEQQSHIPLNPISPTPARDIPLGAGAGLGLGILLALLLDYALGLRAGARRRRGVAPAGAASPASTTHSSHEL